MRFFLGTHEVSWLGRTKVPLFVSRRRLLKQKSYPRALGPWALDSGAYSELTLFGSWSRCPPWVYARQVRRWSSLVGGMEWAAPQDWMCEPHVLAKTGLSVAEHQRRTVENFLFLRGVAPDVPWAPVLQGFTPADYLKCVWMYERAGVSLAAERVVGVGSVCRRSRTLQVRSVLGPLRALGLKNLHGFGCKTGAVALGVRDYLASADSMAWSYDARRSRPLPGCRHANCANCLKYALRWGAGVVGP